MGVYPNLNAELTDILMELKAELDRPNSCIRGRAVDFVNDQIARHKQYGASISISPKQLKWLRDLYREATGEDAEPNDRADIEPVDERFERKNRSKKDDERFGGYDRGHDPDDEIPF